MKQINTCAVFEEQMDRIRLMTGRQTQVELAAFFDVSQAAVSDAKRRRKIPAEWLLTLFRMKNILPEWILTGMGPCYVRPLDDNYITEDEAAENMADQMALRRLSSRMLASELVRRTGF